MKDLIIKCPYCGNEIIINQEYLKNVSSECEVSDKELESIGLYLGVVGKGGDESVG